MNGLSKLDRASDLEELGRQLTAFNWNSFVEVLLATIAGAVFAFGGTWFLHRRSRAEQAQVNNRVAVTDFVHWLATEGSQARRSLDLRAHFDVNHPEHVTEEFPAKAQLVNPLADLAVVERLRIKSSGLIADLATIVTNAHLSDDGEEPRLAYVYWPMLSDGASQVLAKRLKTKNQLLEWARKEEKQRLASFDQRYDKCRYCAVAREFKLMQDRVKARV